MTFAQGQKGEAMRLIDADKIPWIDLNADIQSDIKVLVAFADKVNKMPTIEPSAQPEIIRCKDCYWWEKQEASSQGRCDRYGFYPTGYWYCAGARERKDNETD